jgi:hypothetical protein
MRCGPARRALPDAASLLPSGPSPPDASSKLVVSMHDGRQPSSTDAEGDDVVDACPRSVRDKV